MLNERNTDYINSVEEEHRSKHGQFFTHPQVAEFMVNWLMQSNLRESVFDPAFGLGAFYDCVPGNSAVSFCGYEIDPRILNYWKKHSGTEHASIEMKNYLTSWGATHANIVCNPPYARFQQFEGRHEIARLFLEKLQISLSGYTNIASMFLLKSIHELENSGRLAYIMPLEFLNTGYGKIIKQKLIENGHLHSIIKLDCEKDVFPDAVTTVGIILYDASRYHSHVNFISARSIFELQNIFDSASVSKVGTNTINPGKKWMPYFHETPIDIKSDKVVQLSYYGNFSRGIATGANKFFAVSPSEAQKYMIENHVIPCITRSSQIDAPVFGKQAYNALVKKDEKVLLFSAKGSLSDDAIKYIRKGEQQAFNQRYLTKCRKPWYKMEHRNPAPILLNVFSRNGYKIILNKSGAVTLTCYHGFQPNMFGQKYLEKLFLYMLSETGRKVLSLSKRVYGSELDKFEPNDLNSALAPAPDILDDIPDKDTRRAVKCLEKHGSISSELIDDHFRAIAP